MTTKVSTEDVSLKSGEKKLDTCEKQATVCVGKEVNVWDVDLHHLCRSSSKRAMSESRFATISNISVKISPSFFTSALVFLSSVNCQYILFFIIFFYKCIIK